MKVLASNGKEYIIPDGVESEEIGSQDNPRLVVRDSNGDPLAFFIAANIDGYGHEGEIETIEQNTNR